MDGLVSRQVARARQLAFLLSKRPHYVLGRFAFMRDAHSRLNSLKDTFGGDVPLKIGDLYKPATSILHIAHSGCLISDKSPLRQAEEIRQASYSLGPKLSADAVAALQDSARLLPLVFNDEYCGTYALIAAEPERRERLAIATVRDSSALPAIRALAADPALYEAATLFLGYRPRQVSSWLFWSLANHLADDARRAAYQTIDYHYDVDGMNFLYANFYLLDTTALTGAHVLIKGSGRRKKLRNLLGISRLSDAEAVEIYGRESECTIEGAAGSGFLEDTSCYHKALAPKTGDRLMLQLRYQ